MQHFRNALILSVCLALLAPGQLMAKSSGKKKKTPAASKATITLENLKKEYNSEIYAQAKYLAYAAKAKSEDYVKVAKLLRAAAASEGIHAANQAKIIKSMGRKIAARPGKPKVGTTKENLYAAINAITYTTQVTYPDFVKQAETDKNEKAGTSFDWVRNGENNLSTLLTQAAAHLEENPTEGDYFICKNCGNIVDKMGSENCAVCNASANEFKKVK